MYLARIRRALKEPDQHRQVGHLPLPSARLDENVNAGVCGCFGSRSPLPPPAGNFATLPLRSGGFDPHQPHQGACARVPPSLVCSTAVRTIERRCVRRAGYFYFQKEFL